MELDKNALDRWITGNWGEDQFKNMRLTEADIEVYWEDDWHVGSHVKEYGYDQEPDECQIAYAIAPDGTVLASLGCIDDATDEYRKNIRTELIAEALDANYD